MSALEKLQEMLQQGKISAEEFEQLRANLPPEPATSPASPSPQPPPPTQASAEAPDDTWTRIRSAPRVVWLAAGFWWAECITEIIATAGDPVGLFLNIGKMGMVLGFLLQRQWTFIIALFVACANVPLFLMIRHSSPVISLVNLGLVVLLIIAYRHYVCEGRSAPPA
jgi:hypothetical protein